MLKRQVLNRLLLLKLVDVAQGVNGATRLQKIVFQAEQEGRNKDIPIFNYKFIRWHYGPYSRELVADLIFLEKQELLEKDSNNSFYLSDKGKQLLEKGKRILESLNNDNLIRSTVKELNELPLNDLLDEVYQNYSITEKYKKGDTILSVIGTEEVGEYA